MHSSADLPEAPPLGRLPRPSFNRRKFRAPGFGSSFLRG